MLVYYDQSQSATHLRALLEGDVVVVHVEERRGWLALDADRERRAVRLQNKMEHILDENKARRRGGVRVSRAPRCRGSQQSSRASPR